MDILPPLFCVFIFFGVIGAVITSIFIIVYFHNPNDRWASWRALAEANHLTFVPKSLFEAVQVLGNYRGHQLKLETLEKGYGRSSQVYTRLLISVNLEQVYDTLEKETFHIEQLTVDEIAGVFTPVNMLPAMSGQVNAIGNGQAIYYDQIGIETNQKFLQFLFDWLSDLAGIYPRIVALGGEAVPTLQSTIKNNRILRPLATYLLHHIAHETQTRLRYQASTLICPYCLVRCGANKVSLQWWQSVTYYGCRVCGQSRNLLTGQVIAVLDSQMENLFSQQQEGVRVNWLKHRALFDFDEIEIWQATDEEVERFVLQVGNDTDPLRQPRYRQMRCSISTTCGLTENTVRILRHIFGWVIVKSNDDLSRSQTWPPETHFLQN